MSDAITPTTTHVTTGAGAVSDRLLELAIDKNIGVEGLERLVALHERMADRAAASEFAEALARFQEECPPVPKTSTARVVTKSGGSYTYQYAELDEISATVRPHLHKHGLSYWWDTIVSDDGSRITATFVLAHQNGHQRTSTFAAPTEALTQAMSPQQKVAAAGTFCRRQAMIQGLGLTTTDPGTDAAAEQGVVTPEQVEILEALVDACPDGTREKLLAYVGVSTMEEIPASRYASLKSNLEAKVRAQK